MPVMPRSMPHENREFLLDEWHVPVHGEVGCDYTFESFERPQGDVRFLPHIMEEFVVFLVEAHPLVSIVCPLGFGVGDEPVGQLRSRVDPRDVMWPVILGIVE